MAQLRRIPAIRGTKVEPIGLADSGPSQRYADPSGLGRSGSSWSRPMRPGSSSPHAVRGAAGAFFNHRMCLAIVGGQRRFGPMERRPPAIERPTSRHLAVLPAASDRRRGVMCRQRLRGDIRPSVHSRPRASLPYICRTEKRDSAVLTPK